MSLLFKDFRLCRRWVAIVALICDVVFSTMGHAQTAEQLQIFQSLSPEQQQAVLNSLANGGGTAGTVQADQPLSTPQTVQPRPQSQAEGRTDANAGSTKLQGEDTLLISLDVRDYSSAGDQWQGGEPTRTRVQQQPVGNQIKRTQDQLKALEETRAAILRRNPYQLDSQGRLYIAEVGSFALQGFTVKEARERIAAEWSLRDFVVNLSLLPAQVDTKAGLKPFGYDLFASAPTTFAPATDVPVPDAYVLGPGDNLRVQLTGSTKGTYSLVVNRSGAINFPDIGPINVAGMRFPEVRALLEQRVNAQLIGTQVSVTTGELRSIRVFVLGDAQQPGSYTISGLSTITNALFVSGGVKRTGSLRNIELKRSGQTVGRFDLYDVLLKGDTSSDERLLDGDVIFVNPVGPMVGVAGEVRRAALYELRGEVTAQEIVALAGGLNADADPKLSALTRIDNERRKTVMDVDLSGSQGAVRLRDGDMLTVYGIRTRLEDAVAVSGHVYRPGTFQYRPGMRLTDALSGLEELQPGADAHYVLIRRENSPDSKVEVFSADLAAAAANPSGRANIELAPRDRIYVFDLQTGRDRIVDPLLRDLRMQSNLDQPLQAVTVSGRVKVPGQYPLEPGMRVSDLIRAGGSLDDAAYGGMAELARYEVVNGEMRQTQLLDIDLARVRTADESADIRLQPFDYLVIKEVTDWRRDETVEILGEVRFPGVYPIRRGETLRSVIERAGGTTDLAFIEGSVFTRQSLKDREREQIAILTRRMETDLATLSLTVAQETGRDPSGALAVGRSMLASLREAEPVGRLVIDLEKVVRGAPGSRAEIALKDGDKLIVPRVSQEVTVLGEIQSATSHLYDSGLNRNEYIELSGGMTQRADKKRAYVVRANGSVIAKGNSWMSNTTMRPGDTIVVPLNTQYIRLLPAMSQVTQIVYNLAVAAAAVASF